MNPIPTSTKQARAIVHPERAKILQYIIDNQGGQLGIGVTVSAIQRETGIQQAIVSQSLQKLKAAGVVDCTPIKSFRYYRVKNVLQVETFMRAMGKLSDIEPDYEKD